MTTNDDKIISFAELLAAQCWRKLLEPEAAAARLQLHIHIDVDKLVRTQRMSLRDVQVQLITTTGRVGTSSACCRHTQCVYCTRLGRRSSLASNKFD